MKILLLGATGRTGKWLLAEALQHGYAVNVLVRDAKKILRQHPALTVLEGIPTDEEALRKAVTGCEAVVSALNISRTSDFPWSPLRTPAHLLSDTMRVLLRLCDELRINRVLITSAWGVGDTRKDLPAWFRWLIDHSNIGPAYADHLKQEELLKASPLRWTIVRPVALSNAQKDKPVKTSLHNQPKPALFVSRKSVARFMIDQIEKPDFIRQSPVLFN